MTRNRLTGPRRVTLTEVVTPMKTGLAEPLHPSRLFGPEMHEDPYPVYDRLRVEDPVHRDEGLGAWVLTRYDDVAWALRALSSDRVPLARARFRDPALRPLLDVLAVLMLQRDEPEHTRLRGLVQKAFVGTAVERWAEPIQRRVRALLGPARQAGRMDFVADFARPLPVLVISEIVGIPGGDWERVKRWCDDFAVVATNFYANIEAEQLERGLRSTLQFRAYLTEQAAALRRAPRQDLLSALVHAEVDGDRLSADELLANTILLLTAGNETTSNLLGNGLVALLRFPEELERLRDQPALIPGAVDELLRWDSPVQFMGRIARETVERGGKRIGAGDLVLAVIAAANRDPAHFPDPGRLDVTRRAPSQLAFGSGHHHCVGAPLAYLEARLAFEALLADFPRIALEPGTLRHHENFNLRGYASIPLRLAR